MIMETVSKTDSGQMSFQIVDPDGNRIKIVPWEESPVKACPYEMYGKKKA
jgi:hypothetical protein